MYTVLYTYLIFDKLGRKLRDNLKNKFIRRMTNSMERIFFLRESNLKMSMRMQTTLL